MKPVLLQARTITVTQLVPFPESLPRCRARCRDGLQCLSSGKYDIDGMPVCGHHLSPSVIFVRKPKRQLRSRLDSGAATG